MNDDTDISSSQHTPYPNSSDAVSLVFRFFVVRSLTASMDGAVRRRCDIKTKVVPLIDTLPDPFGIKGSSHDLFAMGVLLPNRLICFWAFLVSRTRSLEGAFSGGSQHEGGNGLWIDVKRG